MAKQRRVRWECPNGLHPGQLGPTRPPKDSTVRYCWPCSEERGRLVKRIAPALERERTERSERLEGKRQTKRERDRAAKIAAMSAPVTDRDEPVRIDEILREVWRLPTRKAEVPRQKAPPSLKVRRSAVKPYTTGHCWYGNGIVVTIGQVDYAEAVGVVIHEAAHEIAYWSNHSRLRRDEAGHGRLFRSIFRSLVTEWSGVQVRDPEATNKYEFHVAMVRHLRQHPRSVEAPDAEVQPEG